MNTSVQFMNVFELKEYQDNLGSLMQCSVENFCSGNCAIRIILLVDRGCLMWFNIRYSDVCLIFLINL